MMIIYQQCWINMHQVHHDLHKKHSGCWEIRTFSMGNKIFGPFKSMFLHPPRSLSVQAVVQRAGPELTPSLKVPARDLQFIEQSWTHTQTHKYPECLDPLKYCV